MSEKRQNLALYHSGDYFCVDISAHNLKTWVVNEAIKEFTHSDFSHSGMIVSETGSIVEATPKGGVSVSNIKEYDGMPIVFSSTPLNSNQRASLVKAAFSYVGRDGYGFLDIAYIALYLQGWNWKWLAGEVEEETHRTICSQLVAMCGRDAGVKAWMCGKTIPQLVFPSDLASLALI